MTGFGAIKHAIGEATGLADDALHIYAALLLYFGSALVLRWRLHEAKPWLLVLAVTIANEVWDYYAILREDDPVSWPHHAKDLWNTMLVPTALLLLARYTDVFAREAEDTPPGPD